MSSARRQALIEKARRKAIRDQIASELHPKQRDVLVAILSGAQYIAALCGRRAGKTEFDARLIAIALERCGPDEFVFYAAVTRSLAKDLMWSRLAALNERYSLGWRMLEHEGRIVTSRGGTFRVLGFDKLPELEKTRGYKTRLIVFDEPATYADKLEKLIRDCVGPSLGDLRGTLLINGTPGEVCAGFWHDVSTGRNARYETFHWTVLDNPHFPRDAAAMLAEERAANGWTEEDATYQREWMGRWINDPTAQVYKFAYDRDVILQLPGDYQERGGRWMFTLGIDFGYSPDPCAWGVLGSPPHSHDTYLVHTEEHYELLPDQAAEVTARLVDRFDPQAVVGDPAAAAYIAEWNRRWSEQSKAWMHPADKLGKFDAIDVLNGEMRAGRFKVYAPACQTWIGQAQSLPYKNSLTRDQEHPAYANHSVDCVLYSHRRHRSYLQELPNREPTLDERVEIARQARIDRVQSALRSAQEAWDDY